MNVDEMRSEIEGAWNGFQDVVRAVGPSRLDEPGVVGEWSVKDIVAHVAWFEREITGVIQERALVGSDWWGLHHDERNRLIYEQNRDRDLDDVLAESREVHTRLIASVASLDDPSLDDPAAFREMPSDWLPRDIFAQNTYEHYDDHAREIRAWLEDATDRTTS